MLSNSDYLSAVNPAPKGQAAVNLMRERTFTPELRDLVNKVARPKSLPADDTGVLEKFYKLFFRAGSFSRYSVQKPHGADSRLSEKIFAQMMQKAGALTKKAAENGANRIVWAGINKAALKEDEIFRARHQLLLVYERLRKEFKGSAFFLRLRPDSFSVFIRHKDLKSLRALLDKPDFCRESFYKQEIFFGDSAPTGLEMLEAILPL